MINDKKIWAFIPARGGSKSIPLKNIKSFCGKPLIFWNLKALQDVPEIDKIIVATDSDIIEKEVEKFCLRKVEIFRRRAENAQDTSTTESVMLEFFNESGFNPDNEDIFMLVQATSPLTRPGDFSAGLKLFFEKHFDSILTCVRLKKFIWSESGQPLNYDYQNRPRRQDFRGILVENGAFYINLVKNIKINGNRLFGKIGIYEMPEFSYVDIDEESDWIIAEKMMKKHYPGLENL
ncbi:MAG: cytidylyltransferase domain-containing protein [Candidatus Rifleibacteriota bacterium]